MRRAEKGNLGETLTSIPETKGLRRYLCVQGSGGEGCMVVPCIYNQRPQIPVAAPAAAAAPSEAPAASLPFLVPSRLLGKPGSCPFLIRRPLPY